MGKVSYANLKLKVKNDTKVIDFEGNGIEALQYLPIEDKKDLVQIAMQKSFEDGLDILKSIVLGIIEGITEWLPISSTGHMILTDELIYLNVSDAFKDMFLVVIQLGAILAVVCLYWNKLWPFHLKSKQVTPYFEKETNGFKKLCNNYVYVDRFVLWFKILLASVPAAVLGLVFDDQIDAMLTGNLRSYVVAAALIVYGILFILQEVFPHLPVLHTVQTPLQLFPVLPEMGRSVQYGYWYLSDLFRMDKSHRLLS